MVELRLCWLALAFGSTLACSAGGGGKSDSPGGGATRPLARRRRCGGALNLSGMGPNIGGLINVGGDVPTEGDVPATCAQAAAKRTYVGCEFWPTVTANPVYVEFDPAVVIANGSATDAAVTIDGPDGFHQEVTVKADALETVKLKWVMSLKGPEFSLTNTSGGRLEASARVDGGAYHVVSSVPVTAWQFNPLQYAIPAASCTRVTGGNSDCRSATNDASLLIPSTAMTGSYRVFGRSGIFGGAAGIAFTSASSGVAITATQPNTLVKLQFPTDCGAGSFSGTPGGCVAMGTGVMAANGGTQAEYTLNAGDVLQLVGVFAAGDSLTHADLSGTVINANLPVQVVAFNPIANIPDTATNADHVEETVLPAEVIGVGRSVGNVGDRIEGDDLHRQVRVDDGAARPRASGCRRLRRRQRAAARRTLRVYSACVSPLAAMTPYPMATQPPGVPEKLPAPQSVGNCSLTSVLGWVAVMATPLEALVNAIPAAPPKMPDIEDRVVAGHGRGRHQERSVVARRVAVGGVERRCASAELGLGFAVLQRIELPGRDRNRAHDVVRAAVDARGTF